MSENITYSFGNFGQAGAAGADEPEHLAAILSAGQSAVAAPGTEYSGYAGQLAALQAKLDEGRLNLAVLGQVKRGKSTLLNALIGEEILPSSVIPLTALPTFIRYGERLHLTVRYGDSRPDAEFDDDPAGTVTRQLAAVVTENANPRNNKGIREVEIAHPAAILREAVFIDTPGIGSTFAHNTEATLNFLPQCDAALFVISADPPMTEGELSFLKEVRSRIGTIFFLLNKADYLSPQELETAVAFYREILVTSAGLDPGVRIFAVSAKNGLMAKTGHDPVLWEQSGLSDVSEHLIGFLAREKSRVLHEAVQRHAKEILCEAELRLNLSIRSLELPLEELDAKVTAFDRIASDARQQRVCAQDILAGDRRRVQEALEARIKDLRPHLTEHLRQVAAGAMQRDDDAPEKAAEKALEEAVPAVFEHELGAVSAAVAEDIFGRLDAHRHRADELAESIRRSAAELFEIPYHVKEHRAVYELVRKPYWVERVWESSFSPVPAGLLAGLLPKKMRKGRAEKRVAQQVDAIVMRNLENIRWETLRSIEESFRAFSTELDTGISQAVEATQGAIRAARALREEKKGMAGSLVPVLRRHENEIAALIRKLE